MTHQKLLLDTNIVIDFLNERDPFYQKARLLMLCGRAGEFDLWISSSQFSDLLYILSEGGRRSELARATKQLRGLRTFVQAHPLSSEEIDIVLSSPWQDPEDQLLAEAALRLRADAIISRDAERFKDSLVPVFDCDQFFAKLESEGVIYEAIDE